MANSLRYRRFFDWAFSFTKDDLHLNRFILLVSGMVYPLFGYLYHHLRIETLAMFQMRILMGIAWLAVAVLVDISRPVRHNLQRIVEVSAYLAMFHMVYLSWVSSYSYNYSIGVVAAFFILSSVFRTTRQLSIFVLLTLALIVSTLLLVKSPELDRSLQLGIYVTMSVFNLTILNSRLLDRQRLKESEDLFRSLFNESADALFLLTPDQSLIVDCNQTAVEMFRVADKRELVGTQTYQWHQTSPTPEDSQRLYEYLQKHRIFVTQAQFVTTTGQLFWGDLAFRLVQINEQPFLIARVTDATQRKQTEQALQKAKEDAEIGTKVKSEFLSNMSHEIRTPLNAILGLTELLLEQPLARQVNQNLRVIKHSSDHLLVLINDILDFSKIESGKITFEAIDFDPRQLLREVHQVIDFKVSEKDVRIEATVEDTVPPVLVGDPYRLNQILLNLASNAAKFTQRGRIHLRVTAVAPVGDTVWLRFEVEDTGMGIPAEKLDSIFESFVQANSSTSRQFGGTGLGLAITKNLVALQGGRIGVRSTVDQGSVFTVEMPFEISHRPAVVVDRGPASQGRHLRGVRVLLVEDNLVNQFLARQLLEKWQVSLEVANNGKEAVEILRTETFDVVLMDLQMPELNGYEATRVIRDPYSIVRDHAVPVIALTADAFAETRQRAVAAGMTDFVSKPFEQEALFQAIHRHTQPSEPSADSSASPVAASSRDVTFAAQAGHQLFTLSYLIEKITDDRALLKTLLDAFLATTPPEFAQLQRAATANDAVTLSNIAHKFKATFKTFGLHELADDLDHLQLLADRRAESALITPLVSQINAEFQRVHAEITQVVTTLP